MVGGRRSIPLADLASLLFRFEVLAEATENQPSLLLCCGDGETTANGNCESVMDSSRESEGPDA